MSSNQYPKKGAGKEERGDIGPQTVPILSIVGRSGSGKTTLLEKLVRELKRRGYRLAVVKHHRHAGIRIDTPGKDTWRFAQAGADHAMLAGPDRSYHVRSYQEEPPLEELVSCIDDVDLILTEGYKGGDTPKIEVIRGHEEPILVSDPDQVVAIASDRRWNIDRHQFALDEPDSLATFIEERFLARGREHLDGKEGS